MATKFKLKRSTVGGIVPTTGDIDTAELAVNLADRKLYTSNGTVIFELGSNLTNLSVSANLTANAIIANGSVGSNGQVLHSNGSGIYWDTVTSGGSGTVTQVNTGIGLTGGPITTTGTISVLPNNGITANTGGLYVTQGTGTVVNATGVHVNSAYIGTLTSNNSTNLDGQPASFYTNATNISTGTLATARLPATANISTAINIGANALTVGTSAFFVANGNVGIGIDTPNTTLVVNGSITSNGWFGGGIVTETSTQTLTNKTVERLILNDGYTEEVFAVSDGASVDLDPNNGSIQTWTLGANRTPGQANWASGQSITLLVDDGSAATIDWSTLAVVWKTDGGVAPTLNTTGFTVIVLWKVGTTIYGARVGDA